jgi:hypothetical protein
LIGQAEVIEAETEVESWDGVEMGMESFDDDRNRGKHLQAEVPEMQQQPNVEA